jgi:hypothetical protein
MVFRIIYLLLLSHAFVAAAWIHQVPTTPTSACRKHSQTSILRAADRDLASQENITSRRKIIQRAVRLGVLSTPLLLSPASVLAVEQRCDAGDVRCQQDGKIGEVPAGKPIPQVTNKITYVVQMIIDVGERREEAGFIRFGLYGDDCPLSTKQMLQFLTRGISSMSQETLENSIGLQSAPVTLLESGGVPMIYSGKAVDFGVSSQARAYAKSRGLKAAGPNFAPQSRPTSLEIGKESFPRPHTAAGLVSIPAKGIGYGGTGSEADDEAYASAFTITGDEVPALDKLNRRVIGQIIDDDSMQFLARLASLPVQKGKNGVLATGETAGPPLLKVRVRDIGVQKVAAQQQGKGKK